MKKIALILLLVFVGCMYQVPFTKRISPEKQAKAERFEGLCRADGWEGVWDLRIHSLDT